MHDPAGRYMSARWTRTCASPRAARMHALPPDAQPFGPAPVQSTATGVRASSACQVAASVWPLAAIPWALWNCSRLALVVASKMPVVAWVGIARGKMLLHPQHRVAFAAFAQFRPGGVGRDAGQRRQRRRQRRPQAAGVSWKSQKEMPVAP